MLWDLNKLHEKYNKIKEDQHASLVPVLIFVAQDIDALGACRMLTVSFNSYISITNQPLSITFDCCFNEGPIPKR